MASRVAKNPIKIPSGVEVKLAGLQVTVKGKLGELHRTLHPAVAISQNENFLQIKATDESVEANALSGTMRALVSNMVQGVSEGYARQLTLKGVGYRVKIQGQEVHLTVGFSHPVSVIMPEGITVEMRGPTEIVVKGADKQVVGQMAANIRSVRPPEPYKGKGIRYSDERIILKEAKKK